ncbi:hypothetical protein THRCLA_10868 [Thraustotheca clavata]|uniref:Uncharacterized protein n=1 Tax=Thraustotheca clavata TaxID=74557 RepID=A0A1V9YE91_9STRA|nr:hypothetical protein THRCLA_10868 [Thraustotheca clavata]
MVNCCVSFCKMPPRKHSRKVPKAKTEVPTFVGTQITATSQTDRFFLQTIEDQNLNIHLYQVGLAIGKRDLLVDAELKLEHGVHYGLVGRNGTGKSTLLQALGDGLYEGISSAIQVMYVNQLFHLDLAEGDTQVSVLDVVMAADKLRLDRQRRIDVLEAALEGQHVHKTLVELHRLDTELALSKMIRVATKRSGLRGLTARNKVVALEAELKRVNEQLDAMTGTEEDKEEEILYAQELLDALYSDLDLSSEAKAREILVGIGLKTQEQQDQPFAQLSGGWKMRVFLGQIQFIRPHLLLLDEPTNHLDLPRINWLSHFINEQLGDMTIVTVSHDRSFLNAVTDSIIVFKTNLTLGYFQGDYDTFMETVTDKELFNARLNEKIQAKTDKLNAQVSQMTVQAKKSGDDKRLAAAASKKKKLLSVGNEKNAKGHRFKINRDRAGYFTTEDGLRGGAESLLIDMHEPENWTLPQPLDVPSATTILSVEKLNFGYDRPLLKNISFNVHPGERVVLLGCNGTGKSTLIELLQSRLTPQSGSVKLTPLARMGALTQNFVEQLKDESKTPLQLLGAETEDLGRRHLARFGLRGAFVSDAPCHTLSGGQAIRLALGLITYPTSPQLLILDEPTNHLDMSSIEALIEAVKGFQGAVLLISHDVSFLHAINPDSVLWLTKRGEVKPIEHVDDFLTALLNVSVDQLRLIVRGKVLGNDTILDSNRDHNAVALVGPSQDEIIMMNQQQARAKQEEEIRANRRVVSIAEKNQVATARELAALEYRFHDIQTLPNLPDEEKARAILTSLAHDKGILHVMTKHKWSVGVLAEMFPDGKVGVDPVCVLGLNENKGQRIQLRLRTDDLQGFRKYLTIKKVLYHELTHNDIGDHNNEFYQLMRQVENECSSIPGTTTSITISTTTTSTEQAHGNVLGGHISYTSDARLFRAQKALERLENASPPPLQLPQAQAHREPVNHSVQNTNTNPIQSQPQPQTQLKSIENKTENMTPRVLQSAQPTKTKVDDYQQLPELSVDTTHLSEREQHIVTAAQTLRTYLNHELIVRQQSVLNTLKTILSNILQNPDNNMYRRLKKTNKRLARDVVGLPPALEMMNHIGFADEVPDLTHLTLLRDDMGLVWLGKSIIDMLLTCDKQ